MSQEQETQTSDSLDDSEKDNDLEQEEQETEFSKNIQDSQTWLLLVYFALFGFALYLSVLLTFVASTLQFIAKLFSGNGFESLTLFGQSLATYQKDVVCFLTLSSDYKPFPFAPFSKQVGISEGDEKEE